MGEEQPPQVPTEELGNTAVNESTQIPVTDVGENPYPDRVEDVEKAHDMALAGDEYRTQAARKRMAADAMEQYAVDYANLPPDGRHRRKEQRKLDDRYDEQAEFLSRHGLSRDEHNNIRNFPYNVESDRRSGRDYVAEYTAEVREDNEFYDKQAERLEDWAGFLHDGVSEGYKQEHPNVDFSPAGLVRLEDLYKKNAYQIDVAEKSLQNLTGLEVNDGIYIGQDEHNITAVETSPYSLIHEIEDKTEREKLTEQWKSMKSNRETTLGEVIDFYKDVFEKGLLAKLKQEAERKQTILEDVKSGRASHPPEPNESQIAA